MKLPSALKRPAMALAAAGLIGLGAGYGAGAATDRPVASPAIAQGIDAMQVDARAGDAVSEREGMDGLKAQTGSEPEQRVEPARDTESPDEPTSLDGEVVQEPSSVVGLMTGEPSSVDGGITEDQSAESARRSLSPDLRLAAATPDLVNLNDDQQEFVTFSYTEPVQRIGDEAGFVLAGPESEQQVRAERVRMVSDDGKSVLVAFPAGTDVKSYTIAWSTPAAVENRDGQGSIPSAVGLTASRMQSGLNTRTTGPDLVGIDRNETLNRIYYGFDEQLDEQSSPDPSTFAYYDRSGIRHDGQEILSIEDNVVAVQFDDAEGDVDNAVRYSVAAGSIHDSAGTENVARAVGASTSVPDLVRVDQREVKTQFDFTFDQMVEGVDVTKLAVYSSDGTRYEADSYTRPASDVVRANFPQVRDFAGELILATADAAAAHATAQDGQPSTLGSADLAYRVTERDRSTGPDLIGADVDRDTGQVVFRFDEAVDDDLAIDPTKFRLITHAGHLVSGHSSILLDEDRAVIVFDENAADAARAASVETGAVDDFQGQPNPMETIDLDG